MYVELNGEQTDFKKLNEIAKEIWKSEGNLVKDINSIELYFKPEEKMCYYVINSEMKGKFMV